jgi:hypothetical protein
MKVINAVAAGLVVLALTTVPAFAQSTDAHNQPDMQMTVADRQQLIDRLINEVNDSYVFPEMAKKVDATLREKQKRGHYDNITSARQLSDALTQDLQATTRDKHLRVMFSDAPIPERRPNKEPSAEEAASRLAMMRAGNFGVKKVERLPFNIGYLELEGFAPAKDAADTIAAAMTLLAHSDALIIDLRNNGGGDSGAVTLLASYLFDKRTRLNDFYYREGNRIEQRWSADVVPGLRFGQKKDVYILTSKDSFSAAEDFAYALKNIKRATVVGETTGGGANPGDDRRLLPNFSVFMPLGRSVSPVTQSNWEGVGVTPDVAVRAEDALHTAQIAILKKMAASENDAATLRSLKDRIAEVQVMVGKINR